MNISKYLLIMAVLGLSFAANARSAESTTTVVVPARSTIVTTPAPPAVPTTPVIVPAPAVVHVPADSATTTTTSVTTPLHVDANCVCKENEDTGIVVIAGATVDPDAAQVPCRCATVKVTTPAP